MPSGLWLLPASSRRPLPVETRQALGGGARLRRRGRPRG